MAAPPNAKRPLSPFMLGKYYRWQMVSVSSILTRITGHAIIAAFLLAIWWLLAAAISDGYFAVANAVATSWFGDLVFFLSLWGLWYHFLAGLRHLLYDAARGMELKTAEMLGWVCVIGSVVLTLLSVPLIWVLG